MSEHLRGWVLTKFEGDDYLFIRPATGKPHVFLHRNQCCHVLWDDLRPGTEISYLTRVTDRGRVVAYDVKLPEIEFIRT